MGATMARSRALGRRRFSSRGKSKLTAKWLDRLCVWAKDDGGVVMFASMGSKEWYVRVEKDPRSQ
jgi:hypothetical protein